jgi:hypothetical protein
MSSCEDADAREMFNANLIVPQTPSTEIPRRRFLLNLFPFKDKASLRFWGCPHFYTVALLEAYRLQALFTWRRSTSIPRNVFGSATLKRQ